MNLRLAMSLCLFGLAQCTGAGLGKYKELVRSDVPVAPNKGVKVTYLGVNGYLLQSADATVVVDPYFTKVSLGACVMGRSVKPDAGRNEWGWRQFLADGQRVDLVLVTHGHVDHLMDAPSLAKKTGARLVASPTSCGLVALLPESERPSLDKLTPMLAGENPPTTETRTFGRVTVQALGVEHDRILGVTPFPGKNLPKHPPAKAAEWVAGEPLAYVITMGGKRIFITAGSIHAPAAGVVAPVDLAIIGVALQDARDSFADHIRVLKPRYVLPSHQDDLFTAPERGFHFGLTSNFANVLRDYDHSGMSRDRLVLLDYFRPWTLR